MIRIPIIIHGLMGVIPFISRGTREIDRLVDALKGTDATDYIQSRWGLAWHQILREKARHDRIEVILIGHSMGCYRAIEIAERCRVNGILVRYIAAIDPTAINRWFGMKPMVVPENVVEVDEFFAHVGVPAMNRKADASGGKGGCYRYSANWPGSKWAKEYPVGHIRLASLNPVVDRIVSRVRELIQ